MRDTRAQRIGKHHLVLNLAIIAVHALNFWALRHSGGIHGHMALTSDSNAARERMLAQEVFDMSDARSSRPRLLRAFISEVSHATVSSIAPVRRSRGGTPPDTYESHCLRAAR